jgi:hypothetical protein
MTRGWSANKRLCRRMVSGGCVLRRGHLRRHLSPDDGIRDEVARLSGRASLLRLCLLIFFEDSIHNDLGCLPRSPINNSRKFWTGDRLAQVRTRLSRKEFWFGSHSMFCASWRRSTPVPKAAAALPR